MKKGMNPSVSFTNLAFIIVCLWHLCSILTFSPLHYLDSYEFLAFLAVAQRHLTGRDFLRYLLAPYWSGKRSYQRPLVLPSLIVAK